MKSIEVLNEVKPKFPPKVQAIWDECGTYIESINAVVAADELEFFVEALLNSVVKSHEFANWKEDLRDILKEDGYVND